MEAADRNFMPADPGNHSPISYAVSSTTQTLAVFRTEQRGVAV